MKRNFSITKSNCRRILVCTLLIAFAFQITTISMVQATSETIPESGSIQPSPDDAVVFSSDDPNPNSSSRFSSDF